MAREVHRGIAVGIAFLILGGLGVVTWHSSDVEAHAKREVEETHQTIAVLDEIDATMLAIESEKRAFVISGERDHLTSYERLSADLSGLRLSLDRRIHRHPEIEPQVARLGALIDQRTSHHAKMIEDRSQAGLEFEWHSSLKEGTQQSQLIRSLLGNMLQIENMQLQIQRADAEHDEQTIHTLQVGGAFVSIAILLFAFIGLRREHARRESSERSAKQSEERLASLLRSLADAVIATDIHGRVTKMNRVAERMTGWTQSEALGKPFAEIACMLDEQTGKPASNAALRALATDTPAATESSVLVSRGGVHTLVSTSAAPICDFDDEPVGIVLVLRDASSERAWADQLCALNADLERRVEERTAALHTSQEQLIQAQKMEAVGRLAGGVAHDFNNLLSVIVSYTDIILDELPADAALRADIQEISVAAHRAAGLTKQLLAFSRRQVLAPRVVDLATVVENARSMLQRILGEDVELDIATSGEALGKVHVDGGQLEQALMNLAVNSRDAMPRGGMFSISMQAVELAEGEVQHVKPGRYVKLRVSDTGNGMDESTCARIFEPFFTTKPTGQGTGLGLATVFGIVQQSGGHISVGSRVDEGTTFTIYIPQVTDAIAHGSRAMRRISRQRIAHETVLVVEDNDQLRTIACTALADAGYRVLDAANGVEALAVSARTTEPIHLVLTDVVMPKMSGRELAERMAVERPDARILFMSGYTDDVIVRHGVSENEIAFLQKPISPQVLRDKVAELLEARRATGRISAPALFNPATAS